MLPMLSPTYTHPHTNGDLGPFLEKALEVKELDHHISLPTLGSPPRREEDHSSGPHLVDSPINCSTAPALPSGSPWEGAVPVKEAWWAWRAVWTEWEGRGLLRELSKDPHGQLLYGAGLQ